MNRRIHRPRWRCYLCPETGTGATHEEAFEAGRQHYITTHMNKEPTTE